MIFFYKNRKGAIKNYSQKYKNILKYVKLNDYQVIEQIN